MERTLLSLVVAGALVSGMTGYAHHSIAAIYDGNKEVTIEGTLVQFMFREPHSSVHVEAKDEAGQMHRWAVEWAGSAALGRQGISRDTLKVGDQVVITGNPSRTVGEPRMAMTTLRRTSDGFGWAKRKATSSTN